MAKYNDSSAVLAGIAVNRTKSIASIERRVGLMFLVSRLDDQKAPDDILEDRIAKEVSITGESPGVKALIDAALIDSTDLRNENDTGKSKDTHNRSVTHDSIGITSLDNVTHPQLGEKLTREGSAREGSSISGPHGGLSEKRAEKNSQDQRLYNQGKSPRGSLKCLSKETRESQKAEQQQDGINELVTLLHLLVGKANSPEEFKDGSSGERACADKAESFLRILADSWTEKDMAMSGEMLEDFKKENAYLIEKLKILASIDLQIVDSRLKVGVMQNAVESRLDQIGNGTSTGKALVEDAKPDQEPIKLDETKHNDSRGELRPQDLAGGIEVIASSHDIWRHPISIEEGVTASGGLRHQASIDDASLSALTPKINSADKLSGLLATEEAALVLTSMKAQGQDKPRLPPLFDINEDRQPNKDDAHDKSTSHGLCSSEDIWRTSQPGKHSGGVVLQRETFKIRPQVESIRAVMEKFFHSLIFLSPIKDPPQPMVDTSDPTSPDLGEVEEQVQTDRERKHYGKPQEDDSHSANLTAEIPPGLNDSSRDSRVIENDKDGRWDKSCQLGDVANDEKATESAVSIDIIKLTAQSEQGERVKEQESVVCANSQKEPLCPQSSTTEATTNIDYRADTAWEVERIGKNAALYFPNEVEYDHYGYDHPFL